MAPPWGGRFTGATFGTVDDCGGRPGVAAGARVRVMFLRWERPWRR
jgi:hypothetical protein